MDFQKSTRELLEKYWAAETTPEEEAQLRAVMRDDQTTTGAYFRFLDQEAEVTMVKPVAPLMKEAKVFSLRRTLSIAASVIILVAAGFLIQRNMTPGIQETVVAETDTYISPEQAYEETKQALLLVSAKLNKSAEQASEQIAKTQPYIDILK